MLCKFWCYIHWLLSHNTKNDFSGYFCAYSSFSHFNTKTCYFPKYTGGCPFLTTYALCAATCACSSEISSMPCICRQATPSSMTYARLDNNKYSSRNARRLSDQPARIHEEQVIYSRIKHPWRCKELFTPDTCVVNFQKCQCSVFTQTKKNYIHINRTKLHCTLLTYMYLYENIGLCQY